MSTNDLNNIAIIERACSVLSLFGCVFIITTFSFSKAFHKPINRLVFYASFGNMMANVGTLIARSAVAHPLSAGCQFQAFLIQTFLPADAFWTLAMAINVYLTFQWKFDAAQLRKMEIPYIICCYGIPFVPALVFLVVDSPSRGKFYGDAGLWCWIISPWDTFRVATYGLIWIVVLITLLIYARTGRKIYLSRRRLHNLSYTDPNPPPLTPVPSRFLKKTTEVVVTTESASKASPLGIDLAPLGGHKPVSPPRPSKAAYSVAITTKPQPESLHVEEGLSGATDGHSNNSARNEPNSLRRRAVFEANNAAWRYTKCAMLFFTAMLVTWIPSSAFRVFSAIYKGKSLVALEYMSAFVLPLQGFWNAIIYITTSRKACQIVWDDVLTWMNGWRNGCRRGVTKPAGYNISIRGSSDTNTKSQMRSPSGRESDSESTTELASSRSTGPTLGKHETNP